MVSNNSRTKIIDIKEEIRNLSVIKLKQSDNLGNGVNGFVYKYSLQNHALVVKIYENKEGAEEEQNILDQIKTLIKNCTGIVPYYGMKQLQIEIYEIDRQLKAFSGYVLFFEECQINLEKFIEAGNLLSIDQLLNFLNQISLIYLNKNGCYHQNLKPANILINQTGSQFSFYLTDFSESKIVQNQMNTNFKSFRVRGKPSYFSPELWSIYVDQLNYGHFNPIKANMYTLGIISLLLLLGPNAVTTLNDLRKKEQEYKQKLENIRIKLEQNLASFCKHIILIKPVKDQKNIIVETLIKLISFNANERLTPQELYLNLLETRKFKIDATGQESFIFIAKEIINKIKNGQAQNPQIPIEIDQLNFYQEINKICYGFQLENYKDKDNILN